MAEGLHPFYDERVRDLMDFKLYLDISDDVKFAWKMQRDSQERGHSEESIKQSIESRKPDFDAYIDPQKKHADIILQVIKSAEVMGSSDSLSVCSRCSDGVMACIHWGLCVIEKGNLTCVRCVQLSALSRASACASGLRYQHS